MDATKAPHAGEREVERCMNRTGFNIEHHLSKQLVNAKWSAAQHKTDRSSHRAESKAHVPINISPCNELRKKTKKETCLRICLLEHAHQQDKTKLGTSSANLR